jgi:hypothetical protein
MKMHYGLTIVLGIVIIIGFCLHLPVANAQRGPRVMDDGTIIYADYENRMLLAQEKQARELTKIAVEMKRIRMALQR